MMAAGFRFAAPRPARRPSLTPMIDVVFLLLVFFMLAARFGLEGAVPLALSAPGQEADWSGPPRLIEVAPEGLRLNGGDVGMDALADQLRPLMPTPDAPVVLRAVDGAPLQRLVAVIDALSQAGITSLLLAE